MTSLVDSHPLVQAVDGKLADLEQRRAEFEERVAPIAAADEKAEADYRAAVDVALLQGAPMPQPPVRQIPELRDVELRHGFLQEQHRLIEERQQAVAAAYDDVVAEARSQAKKRVAAARPTVEKLLATMSELGVLIGAVKVCRDARNSEARIRNSDDSRTQFNDSPMTVEEFIRLVASAEDPIDLVDLAGNRPVRTRGGMTSGDVAQLIKDGERVRA